MRAPMWWRGRFFWRAWLAGKLGMFCLVLGRMTRWWWWAGVPGLQRLSEWLSDSAFTLVQYETRENHRVVETHFHD